MKFKELIKSILYLLNERGAKIQKTKLLKLAYLSELYYFRKYRERLTETVWIYYKYGPYVEEYDSILNEKEFVLNQNNSSDFQNIELTYTTKIEIPLNIKSILNFVLSKYAQEALPEILEHIYFDTEPMMNIERRGEKLDFNTVLSEDFFKTKDITITKNIKKKIKKMLEKKKEVK